MRRKFLFVILAMALIHIATPAELPAQESGTKRFDDINGTHVLTAAHEKSNVFVTVSHTDDKRSCFMVENIVSGVKNKFYTTEHVVPSMFYTCSGYIVNDIKIDDNYTCWFCGTKWVRTGNYVYNIEGLLVPDTQWYGYIGKFPISYAMSGSGNFSIMTIPYSHNLEHFAMTDDGGFYVTEECLIYHIFPDATGYSVECGRIVHPGAGGRFMGVECAGDTVIALSVCADSGHYFHYHDIFYLSYGLTGDFIIHDTTHIFDTYYAYGDRRVRRWSAQPLFLTKTNHGSGVTVSYITENTDYPEVDFPGKMIMFHIPDRWNVRPTVIHTDDTDFYVRIKDINVSDTALGSSFIAALLEDAYGRSVIRMQKIGDGSPMMTDIIRKTQSPLYESIESFRRSNESRIPSFYVSGYYPQYQNKIARNIKYGVIPNSRYIPKSCFSNSSGFWQTHQWGESTAGQSENFYILPYTNFNSHATFISFQFESTAVGTTSMCSEQLPKNN